MALLKNVLGLDLGSYGLKAVEIRQSLRSFEVLALRSNPCPDGQSGDPDFLRDFIDHHRLTTEHVVAALRGDRISSRRLSLPFGEAKKITAAIPFEVEEDLPFDVDDCLIDWETVRGSRSRDGPDKTPAGKGDHRAGLTRFQSASRRRQLKLSLL